jgi:hypothetical protein
LFPGVNTGPPLCEVSVQPAGSGRGLWQVMGPGWCAKVLTGSVFSLSELVRSESVLFQSESPPELLDHVPNDCLSGQIGLQAQRRHALVGGRDPLVAQLLLAGAQHFEHEG